MSKRVDVDEAAVSVASGAERLRNPNPFPRAKAEPITDASTGGAYGEEEQRLQQEAEAAEAEADALKVEQFDLERKLTATTSGPEILQIRRRLDELPVLVLASTLEANLAEIRFQEVRAARLGQVAQEGRIGPRRAELEAALKQAARELGEFQKQATRAENHARSARERLYRLKQDQAALREQLRGETTPGAIVRDLTRGPRMVP